MSLKLNPQVTLGAGAIIWGFVLWSANDPEGSNERISMWKTWVTEEVGWCLQYQRPPSNAPETHRTHSDSTDPANPTDPTHAPPV